MFAQVTGMKAREFVWTGGDVHLYNNHFEQAKEQSRRSYFNSPKLELNPDVDSIDGFKYEDFEIRGYEHHSLIKAPISV
jgi:thymidylate synthase